MYLEPAHRVRPPYSSEPGYTDPPTAWTDIGRLEYSAGPSELDLTCQQPAFSESDPNLVPGRAPESDGGGFMDSAPDRPANRANTFKFTFNLSECLRAPINDGKVDPQRAFARNETRGFKVFAVSPAANSTGFYSTTLDIWFKRQ